MRYALMDPITLLLFILLTLFNPLTTGDTADNFTGEEKDVALKAIQETRSQREVPSFFLPKIEATKVIKTNQDQWQVYLIGYTFFQIPSVKGIVDIERNEQEQLWSTGGHYRSYHKPL